MIDQNVSCCGMCLESTSPRYQWRSVEEHDSLLSPLPPAPVLGERLHSEHRLVSAGQRLSIVVGLRAGRRPDFSNYSINKGWVHFDMTSYNLERVFADKTQDTYLHLNFR